MQFYELFEAIFEVSRLRARRLKKLLSYYECSISVFEAVQTY